MPQIYNGLQSPLEYYAINGQDPSQASIAGLGLGRLPLINTTYLYYQASFKNPVLTGNANDKYSPMHTNALADTLTPKRGKGTADGIWLGNYTARYNYAGGDDFDINGQDPSQGSIAGTGIGRNQTFGINQGLWGYVAINQPSWYTTPDTSANIGQVVI